MFNFYVNKLYFCIVSEIIIYFLKDKNLGPPILDDSLAYKIVDELETWKERQKEMFKAEVNNKTIMVFI